MDKIAINKSLQAYFSGDFFTSQRDTDIGMEGSFNTVLPHVGDNYGDLISLATNQPIRPFFLGLEALEGDGDKNMTMRKKQILTENNKTNPHMRGVYAILRYIVEEYCVNTSYSKDYLNTEVLYQNMVLSNWFLHGYFIGKNAIRTDEMHRSAALNLINILDLTQPTILIIFGSLIPFNWLGVENIKHTHSTKKYWYYEYEKANTHIDVVQLRHPAYYARSYKSKYEYNTLEEAMLAHFIEALKFAKQLNTK